MARRRPARSTRRPARRGGHGGSGARAKASIVRVAAVQAAPILLDLRARDLPREMEIPADLRRAPDRLLYNGGTAIYGPDGGVVAGPVFDREEIVVADLDLGRIAEEAMALDVTGHYDRPDVFEFRVRA